MKKILLLHSQKAFASLFKDWLGSGYDITHVTTALEAKETILASRPDLIVIQLGEHNIGLWSVKFLRDKTGITDLPTFYMSAKVVGEDIAPDGLPILGVPCSAQDFVGMVQKILQQNKK